MGNILKYNTNILNKDNKALYNLGCKYYKKQNYELMKKYYLISIDKDNSDSMNNLGYYYKNIENNYDLMKKYYLMAIEMGNSNAMYNLGYYYQTVNYNFELMKKNYLMAISKGNSNAMYNFGYYYKTIQYNYKLMKKYYLLYYKYTYDKNVFFYILNRYKSYNYNFL